LAKLGGFEVAPATAQAAISAAAALLTTSWRVGVSTRSRR
jgi:hypothetical protein